MQRFEQTQKSTPLNKPEPKNEEQPQNSSPLLQHSSKKFKPPANAVSTSSDTDDDTNDKNAYKEKSMTIECPLTKQMKNLQINTAKNSSNSLSSPSLSSSSTASTSNSTGIGSKWQRNDNGNGFGNKKKEKYAVNIKKF